MRLLIAILAIFPTFAFAEGQQRAWTDYRSQSPLMDQSIVVVHEPAQNETFVILTEPPSKVFVARETIFSKEFPEKLKSIHTFKQRIGVDGAVKDILLTFEMLDEANLADVVARLNMLFYGTDYKANYKAFRPGSWSSKIGPVRRVAAPNLSVGPRDIGTWLVDQAQAFEPLDGEPTLSSQTATAGELLKRKASVYRSVEPGLMLLIIDRGLPLNDQVVQLRKFLIDTDLILGGIVDDRETPTRLGIVGRERDEPLTNAPPLRIDTFLTLAANRSKDLAQSYERNMPFAGRAVTPVVTRNVDFLDSQLQKLIRGYSWGADWAPILLSQELTHTEYGHILNITDQMLKSWSMAGDIEYANFPYLPPAEFPDPLGLWNALEDAGNPIKELTFNWNTAGSAFWAEHEGLFIMTMPKTGALPVSYIPDVAGDEASDAADDIRAAEDRYFAFFAGHRDAMLTRVAQYAAIHQMFQRYPLTAARSEPMVDPAQYEARWSGLVELTKAALVEVSEFNEPLAQTAAQGCDLEHYVQAATSDDFDDLRQNAKDALEPFSREEFDDVAMALVDVRQFLEARFGALMAEEDAYYEAGAIFSADADTYNNRVDQCQNAPLLATGCGELDAEFARLTARDAELTAMFNAFEMRAALRDDFMRRFRDLQSNRELRDALKLSGSCEAAVVTIQNRLPVSTESVYITPSVVISVPWSDWDGVGGHNLNGRTVDVVVDRSLKSGEVKIDPSGNVVRVSEAGKAHKAEIAREFERRRTAYMQGSPRFQKKFETDLASLTARAAVPPKPFTAATLQRNAVATPGRGARRFEGDTHFFVDAVKVEPEAAKMVELTSLARAQNADVVMARNGRQVLVYDSSGNPPIVYQTHSPSAALSKVHELSTAKATSARGDGPIRIVTEGISTAEAKANTKILSIKDHLEAGARTALEGGGSGKPPPGGGVAKYLFPDGPRPDGGGGIFGRMLTLREGDPIRLGLFFKRKKIDWNGAVIKSAQLDGNRVINSIELNVANQPSRMTLVYRAIFGRQATVEDAAKLDAAAKSALDTVKIKNSEQIGDLITTNREEFLKQYKAGEVELQIRIQSVPDSFVVTNLYPSAPLDKANG
ncbi:hypothetical protein [uncultured Ruegeria sp.]|uniref:hypothetical protein n=1 Tax=uncultured Ruegeria sp. TaxID=259304 RepID=UPI0026225A52|nr:hypothetical protein [uncultured Ruegeria sp.]